MINDVVIKQQKCALKIILALNSACSQHLIVSCTKICTPPYLSLHLNFQFSKFFLYTIFTYPCTLDVWARSPFYYNLRLASLSLLSFIAVGRASTVNAATGSLSLYVPLIDVRLLISILLFTAPS